MSVAMSGDSEHKRRHRMRSLAIWLALAALVVVFYVATIVRLGPNALNKDSGTRQRPPVATDEPTKQVPK
jgi:hypothetical protein